MMSATSMSKLIVTGLIAISAIGTVATPAFAKHGADDPAGHNVGDVRGGGTDDPAGHR